MLNIKFTKQLIDSGYLSVEFEEFLYMHYSKLINRGDTVIDVGANEGLHTSRFLKLVGNAGAVVALEPIPEMFALLSEKFKRNKNLLLLEKAVGKTIGHSSFIKAVHSSGSMQESGLERREFNDENETTIEDILVEVITLNSLDMPQKVSFIKMDIEGGEIDAILGAIELIKRDRPYMSVEYGYKSYTAYGHGDDTLWNLADKLEYVIFDIFLNKISSVDEWKRVVSPGSVFYWDYLLIPKERLDEFNRSMLE